jgi:hypothetical protein
VAITESERMWDTALPVYPILAIYAAPWRYLRQGTQTVQITVLWRGGLASGFGGAGPWLCRGGDGAGRWRTVTPGYVSSMKRSLALLSATDENLPAAEVLRLALREAVTAVGGWAGWCTFVSRRRPARCIWRRQPGSRRPSSGTGRRSPTTRLRPRRPRVCGGRCGFLHLRDRVSASRPYRSQRPRASRSERSPW